jgi:hypothetical protein
MTDLTLKDVDVEKLETDLRDIYRAVGSNPTLQSNAKNNLLNTISTLIRHVEEVVIPNMPGLYYHEPSGELFEAFYPGEVTRQGLSWRRINTRAIWINSDLPRDLVRIAESYEEFIKRSTKKYRKKFEKE